jgi:hypothetical protein
MNDAWNFSGQQSAPFGSQPLAKKHPIDVQFWRDQKLHKLISLVGIGEKRKITKTCPR